VADRPGGGGGPRAGGVAPGAGGARSEGAGDPADDPPRLGKRGRWLARQNPDWAYAVAGEVPDEPGAIDEAWTTGTPEARVALLRQLRQADPARGRELLASTWKTDGPEDRAAFLKAFEIGLGPDDEPFLEAALDDRRKEVRAAAIELLTRLPGSRLVRRMIERVAPLLSLPSKPRWPPWNPSRPCPSPGRPGHSPDRAARGVRQGPAARRHRAEASRREEARGESLVAVADGREHPSRRLESRLGTPAARSRRCRNQEQVERCPLSGPDPCGPQQRDADWIEALLPHRKRAALDVDDLRDLIRALPLDCRERAVLGLLRLDALGHVVQKVEELSDDVMLLLSDHLPAPWGEELAREILERLPLNLSKAKYYDYHVNRFLKAAGVALPATMALQAASGWTVSEAIRPQVDEFVALLQFRHDMLKELSG
jgi:hypothetical protein